jgi:hypothetical protein
MVTVVADPVSRNELRVNAEPCAVTLIGCQAFESEQRFGLVAGSLGGQKFRGGNT